MPSLTLPLPNPCVQRRLVTMALRAPDDAGGRALYLQRLGLVVLPHARLDGGWVCTAAGGSLEVRSPVGAFRIDDVEIAAALEVRDPGHPVADLTPPEFCSAWMVQVWGRWPGGRRMQVAQALLELVDPTSLTVATEPILPLMRRAGLPHSAGVTRHCAELAAAGLLAPRLRAPAVDEQRRYRLLLPSLELDPRRAPHAEVAA